MDFDDSDAKKLVGVIVTIALIALFAYVYLNIGESMGQALGTDSALTGSGVANGDFEGGTTAGWTEYSNNATISVSPGAAHSGGFGVNMTIDARM